MKSKLLFIFSLTTLISVQLQGEGRPTINVAQPVNRNIRTVPRRYLASNPNLISTDTESRTWFPALYEYSIGYEGSGGLSITGRNSVVAGYWASPTWGFDFYLGTAMPEDTSISTRTTSTNNIATSQTITWTHSGARQNSSWTLGVMPKYRFVQNDWFQVYGAFFAAITYYVGTQYDTGSRTHTIADTTQPTTYTVSETGLGTISLAKSIDILFGPRLGTEFYLKWIPHLALGFSTGMIFVKQGNTTTTTDTGTRSYNVINGVDQTPATFTTSNQSTETTKGTSGSTYGVGGTYFQLTGNFTLRYVW